MTTTIEFALQDDLLDFLKRYAKERNRRLDEIIADAIRLLRAEWEIEKGYLDDNRETIEFAEVAIPLFSEVINQPSDAR